MKLSRRSLLAGIAASAGASAVPREARAETVGDGTKVATLIDLTKCDGCPDRDTPACVSACRTKNADNFPEPDPAMLKDYWPQPKHEDWSKKRGLISRLTPYNWIFVQKLKVEHEGQTVEVTVPRRCMHCDNPPCANLCPFGAMKKTQEGPTYVDHDLCFGGAKCRTVCPWDVPQRQAGVGFYTNIDPVPVGGGSMFKCDLCKDLLAIGQEPACVAECPQDAMHIGPRDEIFARADKLAAEYGGHIYGKDENSGTSTLYVSKVPFDKIDAAIAASAKPGKDGKPGKVMRMNTTRNLVEAHSGLAVAGLLAPVVGAAAAFFTSMGGKADEDTDNV